MAVQQNKKSPSKRGMHRAHDFISAPAAAVEPTTGETHLRHHISPSGYYRGKKVIQTKDEAKAAPAGESPTETALVPSPSTRWAATMVPRSPSPPPRLPRRQPRGRAAARRAEGAPRGRARAKSVSPPDRVTVRPATEVVGMDEPPADALRKQEGLLDARRRSTSSRTASAQACVSAPATPAP